MGSSPFRMLSAVAVVALALSACGTSDTSTSGQSAAAPDPASSSAQPGSAALERVSVEPGAQGRAPTLKLPSTPFTVSETELRVVTEGKGREIAADDTVTANYLLVNGRDGKQRASMWGTNQAKLPIARIPQFSGLVGTKLGSTVLVAMPATEAFGGQGDQKLDIEAEDTLIYLFEPVSATAPLTEATGEPVAPKQGLPTVKMGASPQDPATITVPKGNPPTETVAQQLIRGEGPKVTPGQTIRVTYTGVTWRDPKNPFDYSGKSPQGHVEFQVGTGSLIKAWDEHLVGQPVGTRLLLVVPPKDGYGEAGEGEMIKGTDTLVFVVDILDAS